MSAIGLREICEGAWKGLLQEAKSEGKEGFTNKMLREYLLQHRSEELKKLDIIKLTPQGLHTVLNALVKQGVLKVKTDKKLHLYYEGETPVTTPAPTTPPAPGAGTGPGNPPVNPPGTPPTAPPAKSGDINALRKQVKDLQAQLQTAEANFSGADGARKQAQGMLANLTEKLGKADIVGRLEATQKACTDLQQALIGPTGGLTATQKAVTDLGTKVDALIKLITTPIAIPAPVPAPVIPPARLARLRAFGQRVWDNTLARTLGIILIVLVAAALLTLYGPRSPKYWWAYSKPAQPAGVVENKDTRSEATKNLQQELDGEFNAFDAATSQKGESK